MKLPSPHASQTARHLSWQRRRQSGSAVVVVLALLVIVLIYVIGNARTLYCLSRELRLVEQKQVHRLQKAALASNAPPAITVATNTLSAAAGK
jgi:Tfp pilus assembly protein PilX